MEIHEITKRQRTDEGILDTVKSAVNSAKTGYNAVSNKYNNIKNKIVAAGDAHQEKQWDKRQDAINKQAGDAAKVLARKGFNVDTTTAAAKAQTPTRIKQQQQQKIAQLQKAFDQEFDLKSGGNGPMATGADEGGIKVQIQQPGTTSPTEYTKDSNGIWTDETGQKITNPKSVAMLNAKADNPKNMQVNPAAVPPVPPVAEGTLAQRAQARNAGIPKTQVNPTGKKDIRKEFMSWISQHIPGIENVAPEIKQKLNQIFKVMVSAKGNPKAIDQAFQQYASIALGAISNTPQGQQVQRSVSPSAQYAQQAVANQLGISPEAIAKLQQRMTQNQETVSNTHTGSPTIDKLIQAVAKK